MKKKRINAKAKGMRRERQAKKLLESQGYLVCKAGGSLGAFDVIGLASWGVRCIQIKSNRLPLKKEMKNLQILALELYDEFYEIEIWVYKDYKGLKRYNVHGRELQ